MTARTWAKAQDVPYNVRFKPADMISRTHWRRTKAATPAVQEWHETDVEGIYSFAGYVGLNSLNRAYPAGFVEIVL